ncbi:hypothetical protein P171DRAFT_481965 [Karstenula rhodostoma CBS 690.94]|uniref:Uncharacterized protein n=1 Tax=Karstenula rhodostoma CBS 690.94 TaxID=1392251 RepID=A0A9P4UFV2_9PLEO|nr:hypothetical protein P171DRAFT_481965 [Karstenula rhodostoma CBS 690.94]
MAGVFDFDQYHQSIKEHRRGYRHRAARNTACVPEHDLIKHIGFQQDIMHAAAAELTQIAEPCSTRAHRRPVEMQKHLIDRKEKLNKEAHHRTEEKEYEVNEQAEQTADKGTVKNGDYGCASYVTLFMLGVPLHPNTPLLLLLTLDLDRIIEQPLYQYQFHSLQLYQLNMPNSTAQLGTSADIHKRFWRELANRYLGKEVCQLCLSIGHQAVECPYVCDICVDPNTFPSMRVREAQLEEDRKRRELYENNKCSVSHN